MEYPLIFQIEQLYYPILAAVGIPVNLVAIVILSRGKCGLCKSTTRYLVAMAAADLAVVIIDVILRKINSIHLPINFLFLTPVCKVNFVAYIVVVDCSVWFTVAFTFDRCVAICFQKIVTKCCTEKNAAVIIGSVFVVSCLRTIPFYYLHEPAFLIDNMPWYCVASVDVVSSPLWRIYEWIDSLVTPLLPMFLIILFNIMTVRHIIIVNKVRMCLRRNCENQEDVEIKNRRSSMILLYAISGNFILLWMTYLVHSVNWPVKNVYRTNRYYSDPIYVTQQIGFMLQLLSCCTNTCIYGLTQRKFREELKNGIKYLFALNGIRDQ